MKRVLITLLAMSLLCPIMGVGESVSMEDEVQFDNTQAAEVVMEAKTIEAAAQDTLAPGQAPLCFAAEGEADYTYADEGISVAIKKYTEKNVVFFVCDIQVADATHILTALSGDKVDGKTERVSDIAQRNGAVLAINGDDYGVHKHGIIIRNGELIRTKNTTRHLLTIDANGDFAVEIDRSEKPETVGERLMNEGIMQAFEFGPVLVVDGEAASFDTDYKLIPTRTGVLEPRTGIGQMGPLHYIVIIVDGRREGYSKGMSLPTFQNLFLRFGVQTAFNLDGGGSTTLYFNGDVLNRPAQNAQRKVSDIVMFK